MSAGNKIDIKRSAKQFFLLGLPYLLAFLGLVCLTYCASTFLRAKLEDSFVMLLFNAPEFTAESEDKMAQTVELVGDSFPMSEFPVLKWGECWATVSVDELPDAHINGAKVYVGDTNSILNRGVGKYYGSKYPGQGGKIVLNAHVNRIFYCLEDMQTGYTVRLHTVYGEYVYRVEEIFLFEDNAEYVVTDKSDEEELLLYTCYPRDLAYRRQRIGVRCSKVSGADFK